MSLITLFSHADEDLEVSGLEPVRSCGAASIRGPPLRQVLTVTVSSRCSMTHGTHYGFLEEGKKQD